MNDQPYKIDGEFISQEITDGAVTVKILANQVRKERTGIHAAIHIMLKSSGVPELLAFSNFNIERSEGRTKLVNDSYKRMSNLGKEVMKKEVLGQHLDWFCIGLFNVSLSAIKIVDLGGSMQRRAPEFILKPYVLQRGGTVIYAPPGRGKSYLGLLMAISINNGNTAFWPVTKKKTFFINLERSAESISARIGAINACLGLPRETPLLTLNARGKSLADLRHHCKKAVEDHKVEVVLMDSISRAGCGTMIEDRPANTVMDTLSDICQTWIAIGHTSKANEKSIYGSIMFEAAIDIGIQLVSDVYERKLGIGLKIRKGNDIARLRNMDVISLGFDEMGLNSIRWADDREYLNIETSEGGSDVEKIRLHLLSAGRDYTSNIAEETGVDKGNVSRILFSNRKIFQQHAIGQGDGRSRFWSVIADEDD